MEKGDFKKSPFFLRNFYKIYIQHLFQKHEFCHPLHKLIDLFLISQKIYQFIL